MNQEERIRRYVARQLAKYDDKTEEAKAVAYIAIAVASAAAGATLVNSIILLLQP